MKKVFTLLYLSLVYLVGTGIKLTGANEPGSIEQFLPPVKPVHPMHKLPDNFNPSSDWSTLKSLHKNSRVVNGCPVQDCDACYQAAIIIDNAYFCGGVVISDKAILTAAHCCTGTKNYTIYVGLNDLTSPGNCTQSFVVLSGVNVIQHPDYNKDACHDVCVIKTPTTIDLSKEAVCAIKLAKENVTVEESKVSGFGKTNDFASGVSNKLMVGTGTTGTEKDEDCSSWFGGTYKPDCSICWLGKNSCWSSACNGDSGGPITICKDAKRLLYGTVSYGFRSCQFGGVVPFVGASIPYHWGWIYEIIEGEPTIPDLSCNKIACGQCTQPPVGQCMCT